MAGDWRGVGSAGEARERELNSVPWLKVVAASLSVTVEEAVCVMTDGGGEPSRVAAPSRGGGAMGAAVAMPWHDRVCVSGGETEV